MEDLLERANRVFSMVDARPDYERLYPWFIYLVNDDRIRMIHLIDKYREGCNIEAYEMASLSRSLCKIERTLRSGILK